MKFEKEIIDMYSDGLRVNDITEKLNCSRSHIFNVLKNNNIKLRNDFGPKCSRFSSIDVDNMYSMYIEGKTLQEIGDEYGVNKVTISGLFKKNKYKCRSSSDAHRIYEINEHYFDDINTQEKAYILGLLYADGCNVAKSNVISIGLQEKDKELLEVIAKLLGSNKPLHIHHSKRPNAQDIYSLELVSRHMSDVLNNIGMLPQKSLVATFPNIENNLIRHFVRGYFDGDGYISKPEKSGCQIEIMGTLMFCESLKSILLNEGIDCYIRQTGRPETSTRYLVIGKQLECEKFCSYIYSDATIYMKRKYDKACKKFHNTFKLDVSNEYVQ